ncbi:MAG: MraY family glycosyltransferase [Armatimonadota bacterium]
MTSQILLLAAALALSTVATGLVRVLALRWGVLDIPNARSSHTRITPRGGGLAIVFVYLASVLVLASWGTIPGNYALALLGGLAIAVVGWIDDRRGLSPAKRAAVHASAAAWAVFWAGGLPEARLGALVLPLGALGAVLAVVGIVWTINLYNFMDGIDGLAGLQAVVVAGAGGLLLSAAGLGGLAMSAWLLGAASLGFLFWNWQPARIFMGDVASGMLGYTFAVIALFSENAGGVPLVGWAILLGVFITDATATLIRRLLQRKKWYEAHREHAFQRAVQHGFSHARVTLAVAAINGLLAAAVWQALRQPTALLPALCVSAVALTLIWAWCQSLAPKTP